MGRTMKTKVSSKHNGRSAAGGSFKAGRPKAKGIVHGISGRHMAEVQEQLDRGWKDKDIIINEDDRIQ